jgi:hypothetical protein
MRERILEWRAKGKVKREKDKKWRSKEVKEKKKTKTEKVGKKLEEMRKGEQEEITNDKNRTEGVSTAVLIWTYFRVIGAPFDSQSAHRLHEILHGFTQS